MYIEKRTFFKKTIYSHLLLLYIIPIFMIYYLHTRCFDDMKYGTVGRYQFQHIFIVPQ
jgi:hypothetical protein